ncbi:DUF4271 domain-containing protein [Flavobacterium sp. I3-2]|uniref:DUF4271 domain-containing protein n=1 Tax=Flavobacterium sp. I3-2 TaxID=2748319 RepID=UPI0015AB9143|nr:DUF4271 domain-containing protein [Flavobacterium sp. I3-2]
MNIDFIPRLTSSGDWATLLFILTFALLTVNRNVFAVRFHDYIRLIYSDKYLKIYKDSSNLKSWFTISMFFIQLISYSFFIHIAMSYLDFSNINSLIDFLKVFNFLTFFILGKYLIEKIIANFFNIEDFTEQYNLIKVNYRTYLGLLILPVLMFLFYTKTQEIIIIYFILSIILLTNLIMYSVILKNHQKLIQKHILYFILYLCTLEIAPYLLIYKLLTTSKF